MTKQTRSTWEVNRKYSIFAYMLRPDKYFNLKLISDKTGINKDKLYNNFNEKYKTSSFTEEEKESITQVLTPAVEEFFKELGYNVSISQIT